MKFRLLAAYLFVSACGPSGSPDNTKATDVYQSPAPSADVRPASPLAPQSFDISGLMVGVSSNEAIRALRAIEPSLQLSRKNTEISQESDRSEWPKDADPYFMRGSKLHANVLTGFGPQPGRDYSYPRFDVLIANDGASDTSYTTVYVSRIDHFQGSDRPSLKNVEQLLVQRYGDAYFQERPNQFVWFAGQAGAQSYCSADDSRRHSRLDELEYWKIMDILEKPCGVMLQAEIDVSHDNEQLVGGLIVKLVDFPRIRKMYHLQLASLTAQEASKNAQEVERAKSAALPDL